jgi:hypothetical protein
MSTPSDNIKSAHPVTLHENYAPIGAHVSNDDLSSVVTLTRPDGASTLIAQAMVANIAFTLDGSTPSATNGFQLTAGDSPMAIVGDSIKMIQVSAGAVLQRQWVS